LGSIVDKGIFLIELKKKVWAERVQKKVVSEEIVFE